MHGANSLEFATKALTLTEKSFKPSKEKHPFIIVGVNGALKSMREFGFQTFSEFWDESYDEEENQMMRLHKIIEVCKDIGNWDKEKILDFKNSFLSSILFGIGFLVYLFPTKPQRPQSSKKSYLKTLSVLSAFRFKFYRYPQPTQSH